MNRPPVLRSAARIATMTIVALALAGFWTFQAGPLADFRADACAGRALAVRADPYREHPLHDCERAQRAPGMAPDPGDATIPAPLPPFVLAAFALLAPLPFPLAALAYVAAAAAAVAGTVALLRTAIALPHDAIAIVVALPMLLVAIPLGEPSPFVAFGIALCGFGLVRAKRWAIVAGAVATTFSPSTAAVVWAALAVGVPRTRVPLAAAGVALVALSLAVASPATNREYLGAVLPAQALADVGERSQFSATHFAWAVGASPAVALAIGSASYVAFAVAGIVLALRLRKRFAMPAALAFVPAAFAVLGGTHVHVHQLAFASPAFLALAAAGSAGAWFRVALFAFAVPWLALPGFPPFALALGLLGGAYARAVGLARIAVPLGLGAAALLCGSFALAAVAVHGRAAAVPVVAALAGNPLAEASWSAFVAARDPAPSALILALQVPTLAALLVCYAVLVHASTKR